ncbi:septum formation initiator family protein [Planotetraspora sp. A-T 1434]|uniref:septum formation initiator family protein n=1 Tax=Planotetraspora sp. A-T 1434 TaxID=2979219 RepID=UPI0021BFF2D3|nr:septum formation initiator family protein [Planotetraspora sp. A-T 1434]MCT9931598.1 septum formation initiator family protein [Planotetraspora sp. A-T 1434]
MAKRPQLTGRAAILAVVVCAIAMSLAYPIREYLAQRRQIAQLEQQQAQALRHLRDLEERARQRDDPEFIKRVAKTRLHLCEPGAKCYVVQNDDAGRSTAKAGVKPAEKPAWYLTLWQSVEAADNGRGAVQAGQN